MTHASLQQALSHHETLQPLIEKYPGQSASLCQTLLDVTHASKWEQIQLLDMSKSGASNGAAGALIYGLRPESRGMEAIWACSIADMLQTSTFHHIFSCLDSANVASIVGADGKPYGLLTDHFLLAVHSPDATVVYYNIARGLVKPVN